MEARPVQIIEFFNGVRQMMIPLFQRTYEWKEKEWETLWNDILERYEHFEERSDVSHFTGAIVTSPARSFPVGVTKNLVIDGQQRLTTIAILLCAIRSLVEDDARQTRRITKLLVNEDEEGLDYYKILPTQSDRPAFQALLADPGKAPDSLVRKAFTYFRKRLQGKDSNDQPIDVARFLETVQTRINVVAIHLGDADDPYLIFESLNAKGADLTQADLVRNYLLLRIHTQDQQAVYDRHWLPLQERLGAHLPEFFRLYLVMQRAEEVTKGEVYSVLKRHISDDDKKVPAQVAQLAHFSVLYNWIITPESAPDLASELVAPLARIQRWELSTSHPLLLKLLALYNEGGLSADGLRTCLQIIESFAVRRVICGVPTNQLKRIFISLVKDLDTSDPPGSLQKILAAGTLGRRWPKDEEFEASWIRYHAYSNPRDRCRFILESLEREHPHREPASFEKATIEHVLPQTPSSDWHRELGPTLAAQLDVWAHTIGNLTLTAYNGELGNFSFAKKQEIYKDSHFELNRYFETLTRWDADAIQARARALFPLAKRLWPRPAI